MTAITFEDVDSLIQSGQLDTGWVHHEFRDLNLGDKRLTKRLIDTAALLGRSPLSPINEACESWASTKGAYRLFDNERLSSERLLDSHKEKTADRIKGHNLILSAQDTVFFTYDHHPKTVGLGPVVKSKENGGARGLVMHHAMAFTTSGVPLGILSQNIFARKEVLDETMKEKVLRVKYMHTEEKESSKWLIALRDSLHSVPNGTSIVTLADRESDFFEFIEEANKLNTSFVIRARWDRKLIAEDSGGCKNMLEMLSTAPIAGTMTVDITGNIKRKARTATVEVRFGSATIKPPDRRGKAKQSTENEPQSVNLISVVEVNPPGKGEAISWVLMTDQPVRNFAEAREKIHWYSIRWGIEVHHKVLKSGCKVEDCRLQHGSRLGRYISLMSIIAFRVMHITYMARQSPDASCTEIITEDELQALHIRVKKKPADLTNPPTVREATRMIAGLGGFLGRKCDGEPGVTTIWRGWQRLAESVEIWITAKNIIM